MEGACYTGVGLIKGRGARMSMTQRGTLGGGPGVSLAWLRQLGLTDNPFALRQATLEPRLEEYFVDPPGFGAVRDRYTFLLFASRGSGKTACRIMVERTCRPHDPGSDILAISYGAALDELAPQVGPAWMERGGQCHAEALLRQGVRALYADLLARDVASIYPDQLAMLRGLIEDHIPGLLVPENVLLSLREKQALRGRYDYEEALRAFHGEAIQLRTALGQALVPDSRAGQLLVSLVDARPLRLGGPPLEAFVRVARALGIASAFVMIDGLDELPAAAPDPAAQAHLLAPLLADARLMEHVFVKFKFFLPDVLQPELEAYEQVRLDRFPSQTISWPDDALRELLRQRLRAYSEGRVENMAELFDDPNGIRDADARLVRWANGSPRMLLELCDELFATHCQQYMPAPKLNKADLDALEERFQVQYARTLVPPLQVDQSTGRVLVGRRVVTQVSGLELALLAFLYQHAGETKSRDDIWRQVYDYDDDVPSDNAIDSLVHRVRKKIERSAGGPVYLKTIRGQGYQLLNTDRDGQA